MQMVEKTLLIKRKNMVKILKEVVEKNMITRKIGEWKRIIPNQHKKVRIKRE